MKRFLIICIAILIGSSGLCIAQNYKEMRKKVVQKQEDTREEIQRLNDQISRFQERLSLAERKFERLYGQYEDLKRVIALQEQKINKLQEEQSHIKDEIDISTEEIAENEQQLQKLIANYKKTLTYIYKHGRTSQLALIFSSASINQMLVRSHYLEKFDEYRQKQAKQIQQKQEELKRNRHQLEKAKEKNETVLAEIKKEKKKQEEKKRQQEKNVQLLRENKHEIEQQLRQYELQKQKLNNTLTSLIMEDERLRKAQKEKIRRLEEERKQKLAEAKAIEDAAKRREEVAKYSTPITNEEEGYLDDERLKQIESAFESEKGRLPWPVNSGTVSEHFGRKRHPVYGTLTPNLGIEILTEPQEPVRVVHPGKVIAIQPFSGYGDVVMVKHGRFITAYGNLSQVLVRKNTILEQGDVIGLSGDKNSVKGESVFFLVRENNTNLDPENWLTSK